MKEVSLELKIKLSGFMNNKHLIKLRRKTHITIKL